MSTAALPLKINANTRISTLIRANPAAIEVIAPINRHFEKLRNPILRKVLASRVTIADAARIGGTQVSVFFEKLKDLGFISEEEEAAAIKPAVASPTSLPPVGLTLDVRESLQNGHDPFKEIMAAAERVPENTSLLLINTFEPIPLLAILGRKGFSHYTSQEAPKLTHTYFYKSGKANKAAAKAPVNPVRDFASLRLQFQNNLVEIDVRELEMPLPMMAILEALPKLSPKQALLVYHRRIPQYLLPQLAERDFAYVVEEPAPDEVRLLIYSLRSNEPDHK